MLLKSAKQVPSATLPTDSNRPTNEDATKRATAMALAKAKEVIKNGGTQAEAAAAAKAVAKQILKEEADNTTSKKNNAVNGKATVNGKIINGTKAGAKNKKGKKSIMIHESRDDAPQDQPALGSNAMATIGKKSSGSGGFKNMFKKKSKRNNLNSSSPSSSPANNNTASTIAAPGLIVAEPSSKTQVSFSHITSDVRDDVESGVVDANNQGASTANNNKNNKRDQRETISPSFLPAATNIPLKRKNNTKSKKSRLGASNLLTNLAKNNSFNKKTNNCISSGSQASQDSASYSNEVDSQAYSGADSQASSAADTSRGSQSSFDYSTNSWNNKRDNMSVAERGEVYDGCEIPSIYIRDRDNESVSVLTNHHPHDPNIMDILSLNHVMDAVNEAILGSPNGSFVNKSRNKKMNGNGTANALLGNNNGNDKERSIPSVEDEDNDVNMFLLSLCRGPCHDTFCAGDDATKVTMTADEMADDFIDDGQYFSNHVNKNRGNGDAGGGVGPNTNNTSTQQGPVTAEQLLGAGPSLAASNSNSFKNSNCNKSVSWADEDVVGGNDSLVNAMERGMEQGKVSSYSREDPNLDNSPGLAVAGMPQSRATMSPSPQLPPLHPTSPRSSLRNKWGNNGNNAKSNNINNNSPGINGITSPSNNMYNNTHTNNVNRNPNSGRGSSTGSEQGSATGTYNTKETVGSSVKERLKNLASSVNQNLCAVMANANLGSVYDEENGNVIGNVEGPGAGEYADGNGKGTYMMSSNWRDMVNDSMEHNQSFQHNLSQASASHGGPLGPSAAGPNSSFIPPVENQDSLEIDDDKDRYAGMDNEGRQGDVSPRSNGNGIPVVRGVHGSHLTNNSGGMAYNNAPPAAVMSIDSDDEMMMDRYSGEVSPTSREVERGMGYGYGVQQQHYGGGNNGMSMPSQAPAPPAQQAHQFNYSSPTPYGPTGGREQPLMQQNVMHYGSPNKYHQNNSNSSYYPLRVQSPQSHSPSHQHQHQQQQQWGPQQQPPTSPPNSYNSSSLRRTFAA